MNKMVLLLLFLGILKVVTYFIAKDSLEKYDEIHKFFYHERLRKFIKQTSNFRSYLPKNMNNHKLKNEIGEEWNVFEKSNKENIEENRFTNYFQDFSILIQKHYPEFQITTSKNYTDFHPVLQSSIQEDHAWDELNDFYTKNGWFEWDFLNNRTIKGMVKEIKIDENKENIGLKIIPFGYSQITDLKECYTDIDTIPFLSNPVYYKDELKKWKCLIVNPITQENYYYEVKFK